MISNEPGNFEWGQAIREIVDASELVLQDQTLSPGISNMIELDPLSSSNAITEVEPVMVEIERPESRLSHYHERDEENHSEENEHGSKFKTPGLSKLWNNWKSLERPLSFEESSVGSIKEPKKTKYCNITVPEIKKINREHLWSFRKRTEDPKWDQEEILIPQNIGWHVVDEYYRAPRTSPPFQRLKGEDLYVQFTPFEELDELRTTDIKVTDALIKNGEIQLLEEKRLKKWRCKPSPLRRSWTYL